MIWKFDLQPEGRDKIEVHRRSEIHPMEEIGGMANGSINCEQCDTPEELSGRAQAFRMSIPMNSAHVIVERYFADLRAVLARSGQCPNRHRRAIRDWRLGIRNQE
jgi:hypothetical protein